VWCSYRIADVYLLDNPISALDDQTQEHVWTNLFEDLLKHATIIVGSSRPVISCTSVLNLSSHGVAVAASAIKHFNGFVDPKSASTALPFRYTRARSTSDANPSSSSSSSSSSSKTSDVSVAIVEPSPTLRSRIGSFQITLEQVTCDV
jgi:ABC-type multidrug transport system ATPase subunit